MSLNKICRQKKCHHTLRCCLYCHLALLCPATPHCLPCCLGPVMPHAATSPIIQASHTMLHPAASLAVQAPSCPGMPYIATSPNHLGLPHPASHPTPQAAVYGLAGAAATALLPQQGPPWQAQEGWTGQRCESRPEEAPASRSRPKSEGGGSHPRPGTPLPSLPFLLTSFLTSPLLPYFM